jgi:hypothetical protein
MVHWDGQTSGADLSGVGLTHDDLLTLAAWNGSTDIAGIDIGPSPTPRLAA